MSRRPRGALLLFLTLMGMLTLAVGAEAAYRFRAARRAAGGRVQVRYYRHRLLGRALVPDVDYGGVVHINRLGFRGPDFDAVKPVGVTRILVVGASTTFDPCALLDSETWTARLEHWLGELAPDRRFQVINAGVPGLPMQEQVIRLLTELYALEPDVIVLYAGHGIVAASGASPVEGSTPGLPGEAVVATPWGAWLEQNSRVFAALRARLQPVAGATPLTEEEWAHAVDEAAEDFRRDLTSFTVIGKSLGARIVLVEINRLTGSRAPNEFNASERAAWATLFATPAEVVHAGYQRFHEIWREVAEGTGSSFIPADSIGITGASYYCANDPIHFNTAGSEAMGRKLAERLLGPVASQP